MRFFLNNNFHVLVVDDNSPDKTYRIVEEKIVEHRKDSFDKKRSKSGLGSAYMTAFDWVINSSNNYNRIYTMDADFSHNPKDLLRMKVFLMKMEWI